MHGPILLAVMIRTNCDALQYSTCSTRRRHFLFKLFSADETTGKLLSKYYTNEAAIGYAILFYLVFSSIRILSDAPCRKSISHGSGISILRVLAVVQVDI